MRGRGRADAPGSIGAGCDDRPPGLAKERQRHWMVGNAHRQRCKARRGEETDRAARPARQHQGQRSRPEAPGEALGGGGELDETRHLIGFGQVRDQRVEARAALRLVEACNRAVAGCIGAKSVHGLGREGDKELAIERCNGLFERIFGGRNGNGHGCAAALIPIGPGCACAGSSLRCTINRGRAR